MAKYTYKDIIIDPQDERLRKTNIRCYYANYSLAVLERANAGSNTGMLEVTRNPSDTPFKINDKWYSCLIIKKEPEVKYVPFDLSKKEDREALRDKWTKHKYLKTELKITNFEIQDGIWYANGREGGILFRDYTFLDGSPVGKKVEE